MLVNRLASHAFSYLRKSWLELLERVRTYEKIRYALALYSINALLHWYVILNNGLPCECSKPENVARGLPS
jgi:hypothetical protein